MAYRKKALEKMTKKARKQAKYLKGMAKKSGKRIPDNPYYDLGG